MRRARGISLATVLNLALVIAVVLSLFSLAVDFRDTRRYGGVDLRNRVVGARLMMEGLDPYYFKWSEAYPDTLLDAVDNPDNEVSRVTVPPTVLMLGMPLARVAYSAQRMMWLFAQWLLLLLSIFLFARCADSSNAAKAIWVIGLLFSATQIWRFHVERGQVYILLVALIALSFWLARRAGRYTPLAGGLVLGLAAAMRPTLIFMLLPLLVFRKWQLSAGIVAGAMVLVLLSMLIFGVSVWKNYAQAMRYHEKDNLGQAQPLHPDPYGGTIEGVDNLERYKSFPYINTSVQWFLKGTFDREVKSGTLLAMLGGILAGIAAFLLFFRKREVSLAIAFLTGITIVLVSEYFLPAVKAHYFNILWLVPLALMALEADRLFSLAAIQRGVAALLLLAGAICTLCATWLDFNALPGEGLMMLFFGWISACLIWASPGIQTQDDGMVGGEIAC